ncbi:putative uncharacterized protein C8orf44 [Plecturocebus cupreus]
MDGNNQYQPFQKHTTRGYPALILWEAKAGGGGWGGKSPEVRCSRPAWPTWQNPVSTKNTKISWAWWWAPIIPATQEAEAMEFRSCCPRWSAMARPRLTATSTFQVQAILPPQSPDLPNQRKDDEDKNLYDDPLPFNENTLGGLSGWIIGGQKIETSLANMVKQKNSRFLIHSLRS